MASPSSTCSSDRHPFCFPSHLYRLNVITCMFQNGVCLTVDTRLTRLRCAGAGWRWRSLKLGSHSQVQRGFFRSGSFTDHTLVIRGRRQLTSLLGNQSIMGLFWGGEEERRRRSRDKGAWLCRCGVAASTIASRSLLLSCSCKWGDTAINAPQSPSPSSHPSLLLSCHMDPSFSSLRHSPSSLRHIFHSFWYLV